MDSIEKYQEAIEKHGQSVRAAKAIMETVQDGATVLKRWTTAMVSNCSGGFPPEIAMSQDTNSIDAKKWPSAQEIADALQAYHNTKAEVQKAYNAIPESQREVIQPPGLTTRLQQWD